MIILRKKIISILRSRECTQFPGNLEQCHKIVIRVGMYVGSLAGNMYSSASGSCIDTLTTNL